MYTTKEIWDKYHASLLIFIKNRISDRPMAEDILQDVFVRIHLKIDTLKDSQKLESWLYQITRNVIVDSYRAQRPMDQLPNNLEQAKISKVEDDLQGLSACLMPMILQLPEKYSNALKYSAIEQETQQIIAARDNISLSGAKSRVQRAKQLLKGMLYDCCKIDTNKKNQLLGFSKKKESSCFCYLNQ